MLKTNIYLEERQHKEVTELARQEERTFAEVIREMIDEGIRTRKRQQWAKAAELMAYDYTTDQNLTAMTALDGEDFLA